MLICCGDVGGLNIVCEEGCILLYGEVGKFLFLSPRHGLVYLGARHWNLVQVLQLQYHQLHQPAKQFLSNVKDYKNCVDT